MSNKTEDKTLVKSTGRGVIYITFAKMWFMIAGWALVFILPRLFKWSVDGDEDLGQRLYGAYGIIFTGVSFLNNGIITGTIQSVSKFISEDESRAGAVRKTALLVQGGIGVLLGALYAGLAGLLAVYWFKTPNLTSLMQLSAIVIVAYSCYAVFIGTFNGRRQFNKQALFDVVYTTLKTIFIIGFVFTGFQVLGTVIGFVIAATVIAIVAGFASRTPVKGEFKVKKYLSFASVLIAYTFILNLLMMIDLYLLAGLVPGEVTEKIAGQYKAVQQLAFIPYQAVLAIAFVIFPMISKATFSDQNDKARKYVRNTLRLTSILIVGLAAVFAAIPVQAMTLVFPSEYAIAAPALRLLPIGIAAFGIMVVGNTMLNAAGQLWKAMTVVVLGLACVVIGVTVAVPMVEPGVLSLQAASAGTTAGMVAALFICGIFVYRKFGTFCPLATMGRVVSAACASIVLGSFLPVAGKLLTLVECVLVLSFYFIILIVLREFRKADLTQLKQVLKKG